MRTIQLKTAVVALACLASCDTVRGVETTMSTPQGFQADVAQRVLVQDPRFRKARSHEWDGREMSLYFGDRKAWAFVCYGGSMDREVNFVTVEVNRWPTPRQTYQSLNLQRKLYDLLRTQYREMPPFSSLEQTWIGR